MQLGRLAFTEAFMSFQHLVLRTYTFQKFFFDIRKKAIRTQLSSSKRDLDGKRGLDS